MEETARPRRSIIESLGEEIIRIITPVTICMFLVVILVRVLNNSSSSSSVTIGTMAYSEASSDSSWDKFRGALLNSLVFVAVVTAVTFFLVFLFYLRFTRFLKIYMGFSACIVLGFMGGEISLFLIRDFSIPIDCITFLLVLFNFTVVGVMAVFVPKMAIFITQSYLVVIGMLVAYWFTLLPEWTTWLLLVSMALYDLAAVLLPMGPLRLLVELAISRDEDIPALVYEARPVSSYDLNRRAGVVQRRVWRERIDPGENLNSGSELNENLHQNSICWVVGNGPYETTLESSVPLIARRGNTQIQVGEEDESLGVEGIGLGSSGAIKLGLGDFIFYSVLVGRAAMYDFMTVYACYLAIIAGLGITLMLLAVYHKALPALPVSVLLGVLFYLSTRILLEVFVVQCSLNLLMF